MGQRLIVGVVLLACCVGGAFGAPSPQSGRKEVYPRVQEDLAKGRYADLDALADRLRARPHCGYYESVSLAWLYEVLAEPATGQSLSQRLEQIQRWVDARPESVAARVVWADACIQWAWEARGSGYANTVTAEGWRLFRERLARAEKALESVPEGDLRDPELYALWIQVAIGQGGSRERAETLFRHGLTLDPAYPPLYYRMAVYYLPRWYGEPGDLAELARRAAHQASETEGAGMAWYVAYQVYRYGGISELRESGISLKLLAQATEDLLARHPQGLTRLNRMFLMAWGLDDRSLGLALMKRIGDHWDTDVIPLWKIDDAKIWATSDLLLSLHCRQPGHGSTYREGDLVYRFEMGSTQVFLLVENHGSTKIPFDWGALSLVDPQGRRISLKAREEMATRVILLPHGRASRNLIHSDPGDQWHHFFDAGHKADLNGRTVHLLAEGGKVDIPFDLTVHKRRAYTGLYADIQAVKPVPGYYGTLAVIAVMTGSPAEKAGLKKGDILLEADGKRLGMMQDLEAIVEAAGPDRAVTLTVGTAGRVHKVELVPARPR
jgi:hypothetical protein